MELLGRRTFCTALPVKDDSPNEAVVRYKDNPWDYLESEGLHIVILGHLFLLAASLYYFNLFVRPLITGSVSKGLT